jgi:hypothetical protein
LASWSFKPAAPATVAILLVVAAVWAIWSIAGGIEFRTFEQHIHGGDPGALNSPTVAQSFQSPAGDMHRIEIELAGAVPKSLPQDAQVKLLEGDGLQGRPIYEAPLSAAQVISSAGTGYLSISFPAQADSAGKMYTLALVMPGSPVNSFIQPGYSPTDALSPGRLYTAAGAQPGDLAIATYSAYSLSALLSDVGGAIGDQWLLVLAWLLWLVLPGLALLAWVPNNLSAGQRLLAAPGVMALTWPLLLLFVSLVGFTFSTGRMWVLVAICALALGIRAVLSLRSTNRHDALRTTHYALRAPDLFFWISFALIFLATTVTRLLSLRGLDAGVGMDAYHHTVVSELFVRYGGIPQTYEPYAPLLSFTYHFGFHGMVAALSWLSGLKSPTDIMLLMPQVGQVAASVLPVTALALFGWKVLGNRWIGLVAGGLAGLVSVFPAYYVEWSRFTEGQALALLPVSWVLLLEAISTNGEWGMGNTELSERRSDPAFRSFRIALAVIGAAGLFLTHYRIAIIYAAFTALYLAWRFVEAARQPRGAGRFRGPLVEARRVAIITGCLLVALSPWLINIQQNFVKNFIDTDVIGIDVYFATAERLGVNVLNHPSVPLLAILSAVALATLGWKETLNPRVGIAIGAGAGSLGVIAACYLFFNTTPVQMESDLQVLVLGLSPVTWILLVELAALAALAWIAKRTGAMLLLPALVWLVLALWSSPQLLPFRLPFVGYMDSVTLASGAWLPATLLSGYAVVSAARWVWAAADDRRPTTDDGARAAEGKLIGDLAVVGRPSSIVRRRWPIAAVLLAVSLLVGMASGLSLAPVHDRQLYITQPDEEALLWMRNHLPRSSYVLANSFTFPWSPDQVLGLDSGLWVPYLAGVRSSVQPIAAYNEQPEDPDYFDKVLGLVPELPLSDDAKTWTALKAAGITHVYIGSRAGDTGFSAQQLMQSKHVSLIYHKDDVWVFKIT